MRRDTQTNFTTAKHTIGPGTSLDTTSSEPVPGVLLTPINTTAIVLAKKQGVWRTVLLANSRMLIGSCIIGFFILVALLGPLLTTQSPSYLSNDLFQPPSLTHLLGTTQKGEDIFAQLVYGARISLLISFTVAAGSTLVSMLVGLTAGYFGGWVDDVLSFLANIFLILPGLPLAIVIASFAVKGVSTIIVVLLITSWPWSARVLRAQTLSMRQREFITAARTTGENPWRIVFFEILPNEIAVIASGFVGVFIYAALAEVALEFLGLGDPSVPSWGIILYNAQTNGALMAGGWWQFVPPGLCVAVLCAGLTFINFGIDELANPALRNDRRRKNSKKAIA